MNLSDHSGAVMLPKKHLRLVLSGCFAAVILLVVAATQKSIQLVTVESSGRDQLQRLQVFTMKGSVGSNDTAQSYLRRVVDRGSTGPALGGFYPIDDQEVYMYSGVWDHRFSWQRIRMFGMQEAGWQPRLILNMYYSDDLKVEYKLHKLRPIYKYWPSEKLKYLAHEYNWKIPSTMITDYHKIVNFSVSTEGGAREAFVPINHIGLIQERRNLAVCVKGIWGNLDAIRLVEWIEFNALLGVQKFVFYDTTTVGPASRVLEQYVRKGTADVIPFNYALQMESLMHDDPMRRHLANDGMMLEQTYLISSNDCMYRYRDQFKYIAAIDLDEIIIPSSPESLVDMMERAMLLYPNVSSFAFSTAWHFEAFGPVTDTSSSLPTYLHMQRYLKRTPVVQSQPKGIVVTDNFFTVNWHSVIIMPIGAEGNKYLPWQNFGYVHHYRKTCKYSSEKCTDMLANAEVDEVVRRYRHLVQLQVEPVLKQLQLL